MSTLPINQEITFAPATRSNRVPKIVLSGASGAGKTLSALMLAAGLIDAPLLPEQQASGKWSDILVADTENGSSELYYGQSFNYRDYTGAIRTVEIGQFQRFNFEPPYDWRRWVKLIENAPRQGKCLILDTATAEWSGQGGILDYVAALGGQIKDWKLGSAAHRSVLDAILRSPIPIIATLREDQKHEIVTVPDGKGNERKQVNKLGLKPQQREGFEYEVDLALTIDHATKVASVGTGKDRTGLFAAKTPEPISPDTGRMLAAWARGGEDPVGSRGWVAKRCAMLQACTTEAQLTQVWEETRHLGASLLTQEGLAQLRTVGLSMKDKVKQNKA